MKKILSIFTLALCFGTICLSQQYPSPGKEYNYEWLVAGVSADPTSQFTMSWRTAVKSDAATVELAESKASCVIKAIASFPAISEVCTILDTTRCYHRGLITGLVPGKSYLYRIGNGERWSEWFEFKTAVKENKPFSFIYFGDVQYGMMSQFPRVAKKAFQTAPYASIAMFGGDLTTNAKDPSWTSFHMANSFFSPQVIVSAVPDFHEYYQKKILTPYWNRMFAYPDNAPDELKGLGNYHFDYQGCRFVIVNTQEVVNHGSEKAIKWLENILKDNPCRWTVVMQHRPFHGLDIYERNLKEDILDVYKKYGVDLILTGHDHIYGRMAIKENGKQATPVIVSSNAGSKACLCGWNELYDRLGSDIQLFQIINVSPKRICFFAYDAVGKLYDHFEIETGAKGKKFIERAQGIPMKTDIDRNQGTKKISDENWEKSLKALEAYRKSHSDAKPSTR